MPPPTVQPMSVKRGAGDRRAARGYREDDAGDRSDEGERAVHLPAREGRAAGGVEQHPIKGHADAGAQRRGPVDLGRIRAGERLDEERVGDRLRDAGADARPARVAFEAEQERADLPVVADLAAADELVPDPETPPTVAKRDGTMTIGAIPGMPPTVTKPGNTTSRASPKLPRPRIPPTCPPT